MSVILIIITTIVSVVVTRFPFAFSCYLTALALGVGLFFSSVIQFFVYEYTRANYSPATFGVLYFGNVIFHGSDV